MLYIFSDIVDIFRESSSACTGLDIYQHSNERTEFLLDNDWGTCVLVFNESTKYFAGKIINSRLSSSPLVTVTLVGRNIRCDPIGGMMLSLVSSCGESGNCPSAVACVQYRGSTTADGHQLCPSRCKVPGKWDYLIVRVTRVNYFNQYNYNSWQLCEIKFS